MARAVGKIVALRQGQGVHIRPQGNSPVRITPAQHSHHPGLGQPLVHFQAIGRQFLGHHLGGAGFVEGRFRMGVQIPAQGREFGKIGQIENLHARPAPGQTKTPGTGRPGVSPGDIAEVFGSAGAGGVRR